MKDSRKGECLWSEWTGCGHEDLSDSALFFFTKDHVDLEHEVVSRALASALQRDGSAVSLGDGFKMIDGVKPLHLYAEEVDGAMDFTICDYNGETREGDYVDVVFEITLVPL